MNAVRHLRIFLHYYANFLLQMACGSIPHCHQYILYFNAHCYMLEYSTE